MAEGDRAPALPPRVGPAAAATGLTCPDCGGSLTVGVEGRADSLHFRCRIGHAFGLEGLLAAKEDGVERGLWVAVTAVEELLALGRDLQRLESAPGAPYHPDDLGNRIAQLQADAETLRRLAEANRALVLRTGEERVPAC